MSLAQGNNTPTRPRIEPGSPGPESDALTIRPVRPLNTSLTVFAFTLQMEGVVLTLFLSCLVADGIALPGPSRAENAHARSYIELAKNMAERAWNLHQQREEAATGGHLRTQRGWGVGGGGEVRGKGKGRGGETWNLHQQREEVATAGQWRTQRGEEGVWVGAGERVRWLGYLL